MPNKIKDTRIQCPHCGVRTWMKDYTAFMRDHDRPDGRRCRKAGEKPLALGRPAGSDTGDDPIFE